MTSKETLTRFIRGWLPKEPIASFQRVTQRQMYITAFIGVGFSLALLYPLLTGLHFAGWYNNMENSSLQDLLVFIIVFFPCHMLGQYVAKLLQKKWFGS
jgi:hypothetical protein